MKILFLHQYFTTPEKGGGTRTYEFAKRLVRVGHDVTVLTSSANFDLSDSRQLTWSKKTIEGINVEILNLNYSNHDRYIVRIMKFIFFSLMCTFRCLTKRVELVFATSTPLTIAFPALVYKFIFRVPFVFEVRDLWPELPVAVGAIKNSNIIRLAEWFEAFTYNRADRLIGLSPGMVEGITRKLNESKVVECIPNSSDVSLFGGKNVSKIRFLESMGWVDSAPKIILYAGTFGVINDVLYLANVAKAMKDLDPDVKFLFVGDGKEKQQLLQFCESEGLLNQSVFVMGPKSKHCIADILAATSVATSLFKPIKEMENNSANKFFDALASSTAIAINYGGWQAELISEYNCGVVLPGSSAKEGAECLFDLLSSESRLKKASLNARKLADDKFNRDDLFVRFEKTVRGVL